MPPDTLCRMDESQAVDRVTTALHHLKGFRAGWNAGDLIDEKSRLSADDLSVLIEVVDRIAAMAQRGLQTQQ